MLPRALLPAILIAALSFSCSPDEAGAEPDHEACLGTWTLDREATLARAAEDLAGGAAAAEAMRAQLDAMTIELELRDDATWRLTRSQPMIGEVRESSASGRFTFEPKTRVVRLECEKREGRLVAGEAPIAGVIDAETGTLLIAPAESSVTVVLARAPR